MTGLEPLAFSGSGKGGRSSSAGGVDPDEAVALGAAVQAGVLQGEVQGLMVMDQWQVRGGSCRGRLRA
jgi:molecular chaperone DnaK